MGKCRDCIHSEICASHLKAVRGIYGAAMSISGREVNHLESALSEISITIGQICCDGCDHFQNRSRFVELPCKVGDYLYQPHRNQISKYAVECLDIGYANIVFVNWEIIEGVAYPLHGIHGDEIGKTVFLTREEAEQALKEREAT